jgi:hypothetical protein
MATQTYKSYLFRTKDPAIDELRTVVQDVYDGKLTRKTLTGIEQDGGPKAGTMANWFFGKTMRPQNATIEAAGRAAGYRRVWVKQKGGKKNGHR